MTDYSSESSESSQEQSSEASEDSCVSASEDFVTEQEAVEYREQVHGPRRKGRQDSLE